MLITQDSLVSVIPVQKSLGFLESELQMNLQEGIEETTERQKKGGKEAEKYRDDLPPTPEWTLQERERNDSFYLIILIFHLKNVIARNCASQTTELPGNSSSIQILMVEARPRSH